MNSQRIDVLAAALEASTAPVATDEEDFSIAASIGHAFLAKARNGRPALLVPLAGGPAGIAIGRHGGGFSLSPPQSVAFRYSQRRWEQAAATLQCTDERVATAFLVLASDVARRLDESGGDVEWGTLLHWVDEWQALFGRRTVLTADAQLGLWGELWLMSQALPPDRLAEAWRGPTGDSVDFFIDGIGVEVKTSCRPHVHHVSVQQVQAPVGLHESYLVSIWVKPDPAAGISLQDLVDGLLARVTDSAALLRRLGDVGYSPLDRDQYCERFVELDTPLWFVADAVPTVRSIDPGVSSVRYVVRLDSDSALPSELAAEMSSRVFEGSAR